MNIISWNINGIRAVEKKGDLQHFLSRNQPDIVCFQEIKAHIEQLSPALQQPEGYDALYHSAEKKGYAGTSIWAKKSLQCKFFSDFPENPVPGE
jgi:exodeoxyribonuclease-3